MPPPGRPPKRAARAKVARAARGSDSLVEQPSGLPGAGPPGAQGDPGKPGAPPGLVGVPGVTARLSIFSARDGDVCRAMNLNHSDPTPANLPMFTFAPVRPAVSIPYALQKATM